ncbi:MAG: serine/threonine-protein phosphatase [bacterium]|nr:serine/threonine-protein phosphatase [bacterium]
MYIDEVNILGERDTVDDRLKRFAILKSEANRVREKDKKVIRNLFNNFYHKKLTIGMGFQRAYGSILSGDYFDLIKLPDENYLFVFADISGHGLPAYTTLIRLRSAITIAVKDMKGVYNKTGVLNSDFLVHEIRANFTDIMDASGSDDFACINFTFICNEGDTFHLKFYNCSMLFPIVVKKPEQSVPEIVNLNYETGEWVPKKGYLLGSSLRVLQRSDYFDLPFCKYTLHEGDAILFYSDGITEAYDHAGKSDEFGDSRVESILAENIHLHPQKVVDKLFNSVYDFIGHPEQQKDDMTAVLINFPVGESKKTAQE